MFVHIYVNKRYISRELKREIMRYVVKYWNGTEIIDDFAASSFFKAHEREIVLREELGSDNVWIADLVEEILVG